MTEQLNTAASDVAERQLPLYGEVGGSPHEGDLAAALRAGMPHVPEVLERDPGFTALPNWILLDYAPVLTGRELRVLLVIAQRHFHRRRDRKGIIGKCTLSGAELGDAAGLYRQHAADAVNGLISKGAVRVRATDGRGLRTLEIVEPRLSPKQCQSEDDLHQNSVSQAPDCHQNSVNTGSGKEVETKEGGGAQAPAADSSSLERETAPVAGAVGAAPPPNRGVPKSKSESKSKGGLNGEGQGRDPREAWGDPDYRPAARPQPAVAEPMPSYHYPARPSPVPDDFTGELLPEFAAMARKARIARGGRPDEAPDDTLRFLSRAHFQR